MRANKNLFLDLKEGLDLAELYFEDLKSIVVFGKYFTRTQVPQNVAFFSLPAWYLKSIGFAAFKKGFVDREDNLPQDISEEDLINLHTALHRIIYVQSTNQVDKICQALPQMKAIIELVSSFTSCTQLDLSDSKYNLSSIAELGPAMELMFEHIIGEVDFARTTTLASFGPKGRK
jgi:hypothetical protein